LRTKEVVWAMNSTLRRRLVFHLISVLFVLLSTCRREADTDVGLEPTLELLPEDQVRLSNDPEKTEVFRDAGLGLFIHWGPNSQIGTEISWPLNNASRDYIEKYYALAETFDPTAFDPKAWARLAKLAGMEYVVFTAKHHDGFCMFDSDYSDFKITNTPYGRDIVSQIVKAFRDEGLLIGLYYSPGDARYHYETGVPQQGIRRPAFDSMAPFGPQEAGFLAYEEGQLEELLSDYGEIFLLWFDGLCDPLKKHAWRIKQDLFISRGEIPTPEQRIPEEATDQAWESCMTTCWQWSYQPHPKLWSSKEILENLIKIRARGGNMLLNVGPDPDGRIAEHDAAILRDLGLWMMMYGEAIKNVRPWTVTHEGDVWFTQREGGEDLTLYAITEFKYEEPGPEPHQFAGRRLTLRSVVTTAESQVSVLGQDGHCEWDQDEKGLHIAAYNAHTVQLIAYPGDEPTLKEKGWNWDPTFRLPSGSPTSNL
jgi:alpha-L-fucosidase